jgi:Chitinase class I
MTSSNPGGFTTLSDVLIGDDNYMYFRGTDNAVWRVNPSNPADNTNFGGPGVIATQSNVVASGGFMYLQGTDDKVWRVTIANPDPSNPGRVNPGGFTTLSNVHAADGVMYFRGTDDKVWQTDGVTDTNAVSEAQFDQMFPNRVAFYGYVDLDAAMAETATLFPGFTTTGDQTVQQQEAAAFLANVSHETGGLTAVLENPATRNIDDPPYYGRGPLQLTGMANYKAAGEALGLDLVSNPDLVSTHPVLAWKTALWYWMTQNGPGTMTAHNAMVTGAGFGQTIWSINGTIECGAAPGSNAASEMQDRVNTYIRFTQQIFGVDPGTNLTC